MCVYIYVYIILSFLFLFCSHLCISEDKAGPTKSFTSSHLQASSHLLPFRCHISTAQPSAACPDACPGGPGTYCEFSDFFAHQWAHVEPRLPAPAPTLAPLVLRPGIAWCTLDGWLFISSDDDWPVPMLIGHSLGARIKKKKNILLKDHVLCENEIHSVCVFELRISCLFFIPWNVLIILLIASFMSEERGIEK